MGTFSETVCRDLQISSSVRRTTFPSKVIHFFFEILKLPLLPGASNCRSSPWFSLGSKRLFEFFEAFGIIIPLLDKRTSVELKCVFILYVIVTRLLKIYYFIFEIMWGCFLGILSVVDAYHRQRNNLILRFDTTERSCRQSQTNSISQLTTLSPGSWQ